jgi:transposase
MQTVADRPEAPTAIRTDLGAIFVSLELSRSTWLITSLSPGGGEKMSKQVVRGGDVAGLLERFARLREKARARTGKVFPFVVIQEADLDGFSARSRHSVSLATETFVSRATSSNGSPRNNRATTANLRLTEKRFGPFPSTSEGAPAPALGERSGAPSGLRPSAFVMSDTPVEVQFTSAGCLNYPCRTPQNPARAVGAINSL